MIGDSAASGSAEAVEPRLGDLWPVMSLLRLAEKGIRARGAREARAEVSYCAGNLFLGARFVGADGREYRCTQLIPLEIGELPVAAFVEDFLRRSVSGSGAPSGPQEGAC